MKARKIFRAFTFVLFGLCVWAIVANLLSDDTAVRAQAGAVARKTAGCGDACKVVGMHGERGMLGETITFDIDGKGQVVVACRRAFVVAGEYACAADAP